jgi:hypothetical protein
MNRLSRPFAAVDTGGKSAASINFSPAAIHLEL